MNQMKSEDGYTLLETVVAMALFVGVLIPIALLIGEPGWLNNRRQTRLLFIANTIRCSLDLMERLEGIKKSEPEFRNLDLIYLSGNVTPVDRLERIDMIKKKQGLPVVVVSTQCVEAGVDIDMDEIVRDFAPWDSLMQVCGRANRAGRPETSDVWIYRWIDDGSTGREFSSYIYGDDRILTDATLAVLGDRKTIPESNYFEIQSRYAQELEARLSTDVATQILQNALSWQFSEIGNFQKLFRGIDSWKVSLFCVTDDSSEALLEVCRLLFDDNSAFSNVDDAVGKLRALCGNSELFQPIGRFLHVRSSQVLIFIEKLDLSNKKKARYELISILSPMIKAYTVSIAVRKLENLPSTARSPIFPHLPREYYHRIKGVMGEACGEQRSNII